MIKSLTPYYINTSFYSDVLESICLRYRLKVFVWKGLKNQSPTEANYEITINNVTESSGTHKINIARLINDFVEFETVESVSTNLVNSPNQMWVKTQIYYTDLNGYESEVPERQEIKLFVKGYGYGMEGENPTTPTNKVLMNVADYTMDANGSFVVPIKLDEGIPAIPFLNIASVNKVGNDLTINYTFSGVYNTIDVIIDKDTTDPNTEPITFTVPHGSPIEVVYLPTTPSEVYIRGFDPINNTTQISNTVAF